MCDCDFQPVDIVRENRNSDAPDWQLHDPEDTGNYSVGYHSHC